MVVMWSMKVKEAFETMNPEIHIEYWVLSSGAKWEHRTLSWFLAVFCHLAIVLARNRCTILNLLYIQPALGEPSLFIHDLH